MINYKDDEVIKDIYNCAMEVFGHGIAIPSKIHPCGWDWLDFECIIDEDILNYRFDIFDISKCVYEEHEYEELTLKEILEITEGRFLFEINTNIDWNSEVR